MPADRPYAQELLKHDAFKLGMTAEIDEYLDEDIAESIENTPISGFNQKYVFNVQGFPKSPKSGDEQKGSDLRVSVMPDDESNLPEAFKDFDSPVMSPKVLATNKVISPHSFSLFTKKCDEDNSNL